MIAQHNPYSGLDFFSFIFLFFKRTVFFFKIEEFAPDEIQLFTLIFAAVSSALIGTFLILRKMAMLANSISHTILVGIVLAYFFSGASFHDSQGGHLFLLLFASCLMGIATSFLTEFFTTTMKLQEDASIGIVFTTLFAIGIMLVTLLTRSQHVGAELVTGNVDALHLSDLKLAAVVLMVNICLVLLFYKEYLITSFDPYFASSLGFSITAVNYLMMTQASFTVTSAFRAVGVIMVLALMTGPVIAARFLTSDLRKLLWLSSLLGILACLFGVALARHILSVHSLALSTAGTTIFSLLVIFLLSAFFYMFKNKVGIKTP